MNVPEADQAALALKFDGLYRDFLARAIDWSERHRLSPRYHALHETDITAPGDYEQWVYLFAFLYSLGELRGQLAGVTFCYSLEKDPSKSPREATGAQFYSYVCDFPATPDISELKSADAFERDRQPATVRPRPASTTSQLPVVLAKADHIQPYVLSLDDDTVNCEWAIRAGDDQTVEELVSAVQRPGFFQFSIYGYRWREGFEPDDADLRLMELAFLYHIHTWNHDLAQVHKWNRRFSELHESWAGASQSIARVVTDLASLRHDVRSGLSEFMRGRARDHVIPISESVRKDLFDGSTPGVAHALHAVSWENLKRFFAIASEVRGQEPSFSEFLDLVGANEWLAQGGRRSRRREQAGLAIWLAVKLLVRRAGKEGERAWIDQIVLAILYGLARSGRRDIPVNVVLSAKGGTARGRLVALNMAPQGPRFGRFAGAGWEIVEDEKELRLEWNREGARDEHHLGSFIRDCLWRTDEGADAVAFELPVSTPTNRWEAFLGGLRDIALALATEPKDSDRSRQTLTSVAVLLETVAGNGEARIQVDFSCRGQQLFPERPGERAAGTASLDGDFGAGLSVILEMLGRTRPIRTKARPIDSGVFLRKGRWGDTLTVSLKRLGAR